MVTCWTDAGGCSTCRYCGMDMDLEPYCAEPSVIEKTGNVLDINDAIADFCGQDLTLRKAS